MTEIFTENLKSQIKKELKEEILKELSTKNDYSQFEINIEEINSNIKRLRRKKPFNQNEMAKLIGMNRSTYARREATGSFTIDEIFRISKVLGVNILQILFPQLSPQSLVATFELIGEEFQLPISSTEREVIVSLRSLPKEKRMPLINAIFAELI